MNDVPQTGTPEKRLFVCRMLDRHRVGRGDKAIAIFLAAHWTPDLDRRFGPPGAPRTIREWMTFRGRPGARSLEDMLDLRRAGSGGSRRRHG